MRSDGTLELALKSIWKDGTRAIVFAPEDLVVRLCAAIPPPRFHLVRYFGVLSSHSRFRREVVPRSPREATALQPPPAAGDQLELAGMNDTDDEQLPPQSLGVAHRALAAQPPPEPRPIALGQLALPFRK